MSLKSDQDRGTSILVSSKPYRLPQAVQPVHPTKFYLNTFDRSDNDCVSTAQKI